MRSGSAPRQMEPSANAAEGACLPIPSAVTTVLLVDRKPANLRLLSGAMAELGYISLAIMDTQGAETAIATSNGPLIGIVDLCSFGSDVWSICARLKTASVPYVALTDKRKAALGPRSLTHGASCVLQKPVRKVALLDVVRTLAT